VKAPALPGVTIKEIISAGSRHCPARDLNKVRLVMSLYRIKTDFALDHLMNRFTAHTVND
jgi:hypothetical protein